MKPKTSLKTLAILIGLICVGTFVFAITKSSKADPPVGPKLTQQSVAEKLYQPPQPAKAPPEVAATTPKPTTDSNNPAPTATVTKTVPTTSTAVPNTSDLANSGPSNTIMVFLVASCAGFVLARRLILSRL